MERATKEIKVGEHTIKVKTYCTGGEFNQIQSVYLRSAKINVIGSTPQVAGFTAEVELEATKKAVELLVVSIDGSTDDVIQKVEDLPYQEYAEIVDEINTLIGKKK